MINAVGLLLWMITRLGAGNGLSFTGDLTKDPADLVKKYLSLDQRGVRLEASSAQTLRPYVAWDTEPSWGRLVVIADYEVIEDVRQWEIRSSQEAWIPVEFHVVGTVHIETATFLPESKIERYRYHIKAVDDRWRILDPLLPPHIGIQRLIDHVRFLAIRESDEYRRKQLVHLRQALEAIR